MLRLAVLVALCGAFGSCTPSGDLIIPPTPVVPSSFKTQAPGPLASGRLPLTAVPLRYTVQLVVDPAAEQFSGDVAIDVRVPQTTSVFVLHGAGLTMRQAEISSGKRRIRAQTRFRQAAGEKAAEELVVVAADPIPAGRARLHFTYTAPFGSKLRGLYRVALGDASYAFTQFEPADARRMLPCFDDPAFKVPFDFQVSVPKGNRVFANAPEESRSESADGAQSTIHFATTRPLPTYLLALAIGPLEVLDGPREPVPIRLITTPGKTQLGASSVVAAGRLLTIFGEYFGRPYPYEKLDLVAVPDFGAGAMENAGLVTFREELLLVDPATASAQAQRWSLMVLAHELAHQWIGNLVTMQWWDDLWLNEGLAVFVEGVAADQLDPAINADLGLLLETGQVMQMDALSSARAVRQPVTTTQHALGAFDGITYIKGARIVGMLQSWLGEEAFREGLRAYLKTHEWGNATAADLFGALSKASGKDVAAVGSTFVDRPGVPLVHAELACAVGQPPTVKLSQQRYQPGPAAAPSGESTPWAIPVCLAHGKAWRPDVERTCTLLTKPSASVELSTKTCPDWVNPNAGYQGYYRFDMPGRQLDALWKAARKQDEQAIVGLLSNSWALVQAGLLGADRLLDMVASLRLERRRHVIQAMIAALRQVAGALVDDRSQKRFRAFAGSVLLPTARRLGWDSRAGDGPGDRLLRREVLQALAELSDGKWLAREASKRAKAFVADPASVAADSASIALQLAARRGDPAVRFDDLVSLLGRSSTPEQRTTVLRALASFSDAAALQRTLDLMVAGTAVLRSQDTRTIIKAASTWPDSRAQLVSWLAEHLVEVLDTHAGFGASLAIHPLAKLCDAEERRAAASAYQPVIASRGEGERRLRQALETSALCIDLRARQADEVAAYFRRRPW